MINVQRFLFVLLLTLCIGAPAQAAIVTFYGDSFSSYTQNDAYSSFLSNLTDVYTESFETSDSNDVDFGNGVVADLNTGRRRSGADGAIDGSYVWQTYTWSNLVVDFGDSSVSSFGVFMTDLDQGADLKATINGITYDIPNPLEPYNHQGQTSFWGFIDTENAFDSITFSGLSTYIDWDLMTIGTPDTNGIASTPEPSTFVLLAMGSMGLIFLRHRNRRG